MVWGLFFCWGYYWLLALCKEGYFGYFRMGVGGIEVAEVMLGDGLVVEVG